MLVISDTTPLITLMKIGHLDILKQLFTTITVPDRESVKWFQRITGLDLGESEAIIVLQGGLIVAYSLKS